MKFGGESTSHGDSAMCGVFGFSFIAYQFQILTSHRMDQIHYGMAHRWSQNRDVVRFSSSGGKVD